MYDISEKVRNVITDNAANMKKAFNFSLPGFPDSLVDEKSENESGDESDSESENDDFNVELPDDNFPTLGHCFAHTLQLVVKDGLKQTGSSLKTVISKVGNIVKFVRKSVNASDIIENENRLQSDNATRWNSQIIMIRSILSVSTWGKTSKNLGISSVVSLWEKTFEGTLLYTETIWRRHTYGSER